MIDEDCNAMGGYQRKLSSEDTFSCTCIHGLDASFKFYSALDAVWEGRIGGVTTVYYTMVIKAADDLRKVMRGTSIDSRGKCKVRLLICVPQLDVGRHFSLICYQTAFIRI